MGFINNESGDLHKDRMCTRIYVKPLENASYAVSLHVVTCPEKNAGDFSRAIWQDHSIITCMSGLVCNSKITLPPSPLANLTMNISNFKSSCNFQQKTTVVRGYLDFLIVSIQFCSGLLQKPLPRSTTTRTGEQALCQPSDNSSHDIRLKVTW